MEETEKEREERVKQWEDFLDEGEAKNSKDKDGQKTVATKDQSTTETVS